MCVCDKVVGNKLCVTKLWVTSCVKEAGLEEEDEEEARDRESKTRTPHKDVGKYSGATQLDQQARPGHAKAAPSCRFHRTWPGPASSV